MEVANHAYPDLPFLLSASQPQDPLPSNSKRIGAAFSRLHLNSGRAIVTTGPGRAYSQIKIKGQ